MAVQLLLGVAEIDITPPVGTHLCGSLTPRVSDGVDDPLLVKAIVLQSGDVKLAFGVFDLTLLLQRETLTETLFPWTYPVELAGGYLGYLITAAAWEAGGYESLLSRVGNIDVPGVETMVETDLAMLRELHGHHGV